MGASAVLAVALAAAAVFATAPSAKAADKCAGVTTWAISIPPIATYYFVDTGGGWVSSHSPDGADPFGTVDLSASGSSFHAFNKYAPSYDYDATFSGTLSSACVATGTWTSNHDPKGGTFTATPIGFTAPCTTEAPRGVASAAASKCCKPEVAVTATAHVSRSGRDVVVTITASGLGPEAKCGSATLSADHETVKVIPRSGTATATVRLTGSRSCVTTLTASVTQADASASRQETIAGGAPTFVVATAVRDSKGTVKLVAQIAGLRPTDVCGPPTITATVAHATRAVVPFTIESSSASKVTAHASLTGREKCATLVQFQVRQEQIDEDVGAPAITGDPPSGICQS